MSEFLELQKKSMEVNGFWAENNKRTICDLILSRHNRDIIREWGISDILVNGDKLLLKWYKRHIPLSNDQLKDQFDK